MRARAFLVPMLAVLGLTGCLWHSGVVKVKTDGSGTVTETTLLRPEAVAMMKQMVAGFAAQAGAAGAPPPEPELFKESDAQARAGKMGEGVSFVSAEKVSNDHGEGQKAVYAFKNVAKLKVDQKPVTPSAPGGGPGMGPGGGKAENISFRFGKSPKGNALLTVQFPGMGKPPAEAKAADAPSEAPTPDPQQMAMMKQMLKGMKISYAVEVDGTIVATNCPNVNGSTVTLLEIDFDALLADEAKFNALAAKNPKTLEEAKAVMKDLKGCTIPLEPEITIEFKAK